MAQPLPVRPVPLQELLLEDYIATILPPVLFRAPYITPDGFYKLNNPHRPSNLAEVRAISQKEFVVSVEQFHDTIIPQNIHRELPVLPYPKVRSYLALRDPDPSGRVHVGLLPDPLSFTISTIEHLDDLFKDRVLPTLHYLMRALDFSDWPGRFVDDLCMDYDTISKYYRMESRLCDYEWKPYDGFTEYNIRAYRWGSMRLLPDRESVLLVILPPWLLTPNEFAKLTSSRKPEPILEDYTSNLPLAESVLHRITLHCSGKLKCRHFIVSTFNEFAFGTFDTLIPGLPTCPTSPSAPPTPETGERWETDYTIMHITPPLPFYSCAPGYRYPGPLSFHPKLDPMAPNIFEGLPRAFGVSALEAVRWWLYKAVNAPESGSGYGVPVVPPEPFRKKPPRPLPLAKRNRKKLRREVKSKKRVGKTKQKLQEFNSAEQANEDVELADSDGDFDKEDIQMQGMEVSLVPVKEAAWIHLVQGTKTMEDLDAQDIDIMGSIAATADRTYLPMAAQFAAEMSNYQPVAGPCRKRRREDEDEDERDHARYSGGSNQDVDSDMGPDTTDSEYEINNRLLCPTNPPLKKRKKQLRPIIITRRGYRYWMWRERPRCPSPIRPAYHGPPKPGIYDDREPSAETEIDDREYPRPASTVKSQIKIEPQESSVDRKSRSGILPPTEGVCNRNASQQSARIHRTDTETTEPEVPEEINAYEASAAVIHQEAGLLGPSGFSSLVQSFRIAKTRSIAKVPSVVMEERSTDDNE